MNSPERHIPVTSPAEHLHLVPVEIRHDEQLPAPSHQEIREARLDSLRQMRDAGVVAVKANLMHNVQNEHVTTGSHQVVTQEAIDALKHQKGL